MKLGATMGDRRPHQKLDAETSPADRDATFRLLLQPEVAAPTLSRFRRLQSAWRRLPVPAWARVGLTGLFYRLSGRARSLVDLDRSLESVTSLIPRPAGAIPPGRLMFSGYQGDTSGIGRGGRLSIAALRRAGLSPELHDLRRAPEGWGRQEPGGVWFCHCNAMEAADFLVTSQDAHACYRVGYWAWELPNLPPAWANILPLFHEVWAPSRFIVEAIEKAMPPGKGPIVRCVPHPRPAVGHVQPDRARWGLAAEVFAFLCMYDVHSSATRKNPMGAVLAFQRAFRPEQGDVCLLIKVTAAADSRSCLDELHALTAAWPNIRIVTDMLSDEDSDRLIRSADAFVSLHRAEGFGLSIAQAMAMGRPVIVTAWSGNLDFCGEGADLIDCRLIPATDPHGVYRDYEATGQVWADPDLDAAAAAMRRFATDRTSARALGAAAQAHIRQVLPEGYDVDPLKRWIA